MVILRTKRAIFSGKRGIALIVMAIMVFSVMTVMGTHAATTRSDLFQTPNGMRTTTESYLLESSHPYDNNFDHTWEITKPGATQIRVHFTYIEVEDNYDFLYVYDYAGNQLHKLTGTYSSGGWSSYSNGDTIKIRLDTDYSVTKWGFKIDQIEYEAGTGGGGDTGPGELTNGQTVTSSLSGTGDSEMWTIQVDANAVSMHSVLNCGSSDYDLYGRLGAEPTTSTYDWRGYTSGGEDVTYDNPGQGTWYIMVNSYSGSGAYDLTVTVTYDSGSGGGGSNELTNGQTVSSSLSGTGATEMWTIQVDANAVSMHSVLNCGSNDYDLYGRLGAEPTTSTYDWRGYTSGGEDVTYDNPGEGTWYIMVRSYSGSGAYDLTVTITYDSGGGSSTWGNGGKYAIVIGISDYQYINDLSYADDDAADWYYFLSNHGFEVHVYGDSHTSNYPRYDGLATEANVRAAIQELAGHAQPGDTVVITTSGHGGADETNGWQYSGGGETNDVTSFLCMVDSNGGTTGNYYESEIVADLNQFQSGVKITWVVDHCHSGGIGPDVMASNNGGDILFLTTASGNGYGYDEPNYQNGKFTYWMLQAFNTGGQTTWEDAFSWIMVDGRYLPVDNAADNPQIFDGNTAVDYSP